MTNGSVRTESKSRIWIAWLLLFALMPLSVVKTFHHHEVCTSAVCSDEGDSQSSCDDDCPICHFSLLPFTPSETFRICTFETPTALDPVAEIEDIRGESFSAYSLRAPPFA